MKHTSNISFCSKRVYIFQSVADIILLLFKGTKGLLFIAKFFSSFCLIHFVHFAESSLTTYNIHV